LRSCALTAPRRPTTATPDVPDDIDN
ncbi:hypothetical protein Tco_0675266, partial [Tanacetum coccineum]